VLTEPNELNQSILLQQCREAFTALLKEQQKSKPSEKKQKKEVDVQVDDLIRVRQLLPKRGFGLEDLDDMGMLSHPSSYSLSFNPIKTILSHYFCICFRYLTSSKHSLVVVFHSFAFVHQSNVNQPHCGYCCIVSGFDFDNSSNNSL
jgi:hypothetical protein